MLSTPIIFLSMTIMMGYVTSNGEIGYDVIHMYLCTGDTAWGDNIHDATLRPILKLAIRLVCRDPGSDDYVLVAVLEALDEFYKDIPPQSRQDFMSCFLEGLRDQLRGVVCSENRHEFTASLRTLVQGVFACDTNSPTILCRLLEIGLLMFETWVDQQRAHLCKTSAKSVLHIMARSSSAKSALRIMTRQYDLPNMVKLMQHLTCHGTTFLNFAVMFFKENSYQFSDQVDEYLFQFLMELASRFLCCLMDVAAGDHQK